jgi:hypothetical protein
VTTPLTSWEEGQSALQFLESAAALDLPERFRHARALLAGLKQLADNLLPTPATAARALAVRAAAVRQALRFDPLEGFPEPDAEWERLLGPFSGRPLSEGLVREFLAALERHTEAARTTTAEVERLHNEVELATRRHRLLQGYRDCLEALAECVCSPREAPS